MGVKLQRNQIDHQKNHGTLQTLINTKTKIALLKTRKVWHNCHDKGLENVKFDGITWTKKPNVVIGQTMMQFTSVQTGNIYEADISVEIAADLKSYKIVFPKNDVTKACVIFIPNEAA